MFDLNNIEERIQELRKAKGLSQEQLADILGVSRQAVSKWEGGQSLPEVEKLLAMSELFEVPVDYILKAEFQPKQNERNGARLGAQILYAAATMLFAIAVAATLGQASDGTYTMDIYGGLIIESVGIMAFLVGFFLAGGKLLNKPLFVVNVLLAGILPSMLISQTLLTYYPQPYSMFSPIAVLSFAVPYLAICGIIIFFAIIRKKR